MMNLRGEQGSTLVDEQGFTLVEVLVAIVMTVVVFGAALTALVAFQHNTTNGILRNEAQDRARNALDRLARGLRSVAAPTTKFSGALEEAASYSITFQTIDSEKTAGGSNTTNAMRVRYCLNDSTPTNEVLWQQVKRWTTAEAPTLVSSSECPDNTAGRWDSSYKLASAITNRIGGQNRVAFTYSAGSTPQIVAVESKLYIDLKPGSQPGESELTTATSLRNANRPPIVSFTATKINGHVLLNGSESRDPEGLALTYKWTEGSTVLPSTSQQYETGALTTGSHTFTLEVTDPGGLSSSTSQTVVI
ncbi:MAG: prepilin-type N-terminal cleavage/methylation domain-containing protein [Actinobacteria bacterium]|nr:MAG: prepilin-type N-terminal cleavage/methylation domain-containing protein [Actinomycetota bacterium]